MTTFNKDAFDRSQRLAGWVAVLAGIIGFGGFVFIIAALFIRTDAKHLGVLMFRGHDGMSLLQSFCMIIVVTALCSLSQSWHRPIPKIAYRLAYVALALLILALLLTFAKVVNDMIYMVPQGIFGLWMIWLSLHLLGRLPRHVSWSGIIAGVGLTLIGIFPIAFGVFVDSIVFRGPMPPDYRDVNSTANLVVHVLLAVGTLIGLPFYPIWSITVGRVLLREAS